MRRQLVPALLIFAIMSVALGIAYPLVVTGIATVAFPDHAEGSFVEVDGAVVGSELLGQAFSGTTWFHPRPSAAGDGYDASSSSGSNLGPTNTDLLDDVAARGVRYREENDLPDEVLVPVDAVTGSGSGLDPHISIANARLQAPRVAAGRGLPLPEVLELIDAHTDPRPLGVLGDSGVNVLLLNVAIAQASGSR
jgi:potassium-transporting ATPase KdpC subunit